MLEPEATSVRRLEVITGTGRRRLFSEDFKASIVEETLVPGAVVSEVARRNGLTPQQVFTWRRQARQPIASEAEAPKFVPAVVNAALPARPSRGQARKRTRQLDRNSGSIEVEIEGVSVRIGRGAEAKTVAAMSAAPSVKTRASQSPTA
jgi:transposase